ncbi:MAG: hypothetical protein ABI873_03095 [Marmoricola sp.]
MTEMTEQGNVPGSSTAHRGPHPGLIGLVSLGLMLAGLAIGGALSGGDTLASPFGPTAEVVRRIHEHWNAVRVAAFFQFASAVPLAIYAATVYARQLRLGVRVPGPVISLVGGIMAVVSLLVSAFAQFVLSRPEVTTDARLTHALSFFSFVSGGTGYVVGLGLLIAGIAVPAYILRLMPRWLAGTGLVLALLAELSSLSMLVEVLQYLLPVGRFLGTLWLIAAGFLLPTQRPRRTEEAS